MTTLAPFLRSHVPNVSKSILSHACHARCMGLAYVRAVAAQADSATIRQRERWLWDALVVIAERDENPELALSIQEHVEARERAVRGLPPLTCEATYSDLVTPADRKGFVSRLVARLADAFDCKGAWD